MKRYNDKEINRLLAAADDLLADIQLYETPEEEKRRKEKEEELRKQAETERVEEELRRQEEARQAEEEPEKQEEICQTKEELWKQEETAQAKEKLRKQEEAHQAEEELRKQEEARQTEEELRKQEEARQAEEELRKQEETGQVEEPQQQENEQAAADLTEAVPQQEELEQQIDIHQLEILGEEEALRRLEAIQRQEAIRQQEEARQLKRMRWRELNGQGEASELSESINDGESVQSEEDYRSKADLSGIEQMEEPELAVSEQQNKIESGEMKSDEIERDSVVSGQIKQPDRSWLNMLFIIISMIYLELLTHFGIYQDMTMTVVYPVLFAAGFGSVITVVASFLSKRWNALIVCIMLLLGSLYCDLQLLYHAVAGTFLNLTGLPAEISLLFQSGDTLFHGMMEMLPFLLFMFLPVLLWIFVGRDWIHFERSTWLKRLLTVVLGCILTVLSILCLDIHGYEADSPYICAYHFDSDTLLEPTGKQLGMTAMTVLEILESMK